MEIPFHDMTRVGQAALDALTASDPLIKALIVVYEAHAKSKMTTEAIALIDQLIFEHEYQRTKYDNTVRRYRT